jgi:hypothetical protein
MITQEIKKLQDEYQEASKQEEILNNSEKAFDEAENLTEAVENAVNTLPDGFFND